MHALYEDDVGGEADIFHLNLLPKIDVKRYFAGSRQLAVRVQEAVYYLLHDPTGTSLVMADRAGNGLGQMLYDGYGAVLSATLPVTVSSTLLDAPDPTTHLLYLGEGRWYDPALGRPLQPNAAGGPPTVPQALNRYAATATGQPGVAQATAATSSGGTFFDHPTHRVATVVSRPNATAIALRDTVAQTALGYAAGKVIEETATGPLTVIISKSSWYRTIGAADQGLRSLFRQPSVAQPQFGKTFRAYTTLGRVRSLGDGRYFAEAGQIIDASDLPASARVRLNPRWDSAARHLAGAGFAFGVSAAFQWVEDASPYLTTEQRVFRAGVSGLGGLTAWAIGAGATQIATGAGVVAWAGPMGIAIGGGVTFVWIKWVQPIIFDYVGANPQRNLMELQSN